MSRNTKFFTLAASLFAAQGALAQGVIEEIVVMAQKREQNAQEVPVALSVLGKSAIETLDIKDFTDVKRVSPSLTIEQAASPNDSVIRMRGVGTFSYSIAAEPSVSVVVDDVPLMRSAQAFNNLVDIERIEVLRGPQGTLFGKNASAGVVNIVTQAPSEEFTARVGVRFTDDDEQKADVSISGPLGDTVAYRLSGYYVDRDGYIDNLTDGSRLNGEEASGVRAKLLWDPTESLEIELILDTSTRDTSSTWTWVEAAPFIPGPGVTPGEDNTNVRLDTVNVYKADQDIFALKVDYDLPGHVLTSITSQQGYELKSRLDGDLTDAPIELVFDAGPSFFNPLAMTGPQVDQQDFHDYDGFMQEFRLTSTSSESFEYVIGLFYADVENTRMFDRKPLRFVLNKWDATATTESMALFGQGSLAVGENTFLDVGLRFNDEKISVSFTDYYANGFVPEIPETYTGSDSQSAVTGKLALRHFLDSGAMVFGSVSTGYKGQAYDVTSGFTQADADQPVGEETSVSYELGIKGMSNDRSLTYDVVAFLTDFDDYQAQGAVVDASGTPVFTLTNVGKLRTQGVEADVQWQASDSWRLFASVAWIDATIESFPNAQCYDGQTEAEGCMPGAGPGGLDVQDLSGADLANSPDLKYNVGAYWEQSGSSRSFNFFAQANYQWQDDVNFDLFGNPVASQDAYGIANASFGIVDSDGRYNVTLFVNNAFDERYSLGYTDFSNRFGGATAVAKQWSRESQQYAGIKATISF